MRIRKALIVAGALALPLSSVTLLEGPAFAGKVAGGGQIVCPIGGTISFSPPLTPNGTPGSKEVITVTTTPGSGPCRSGSPAATPAQTSGTTTTKPVKIKGTGHPKRVGACSMFTSASSTAVVKSKINWNNPVEPTKTVLSNGTSITVGSEVGTQTTGTASGSYPGSATTRAVFNQSSSNAIVACIEDTSSAPVSTLTLDPTQSSSTLG
jgi:hypothetical protein